MIVTVSASYGAGGSELGPRVARRLGLRFIDRAIPVAVAEQLGISVEDAEVVRQDAPSRFWQLFAQMSTLAGGLEVPASPEQVTEHDLIESTEAALRAAADEGDVLILGHAGAVVLAERSDVLHVRLDGPPQGRVRAAMGRHHIDSDAATALQRDNDKVRTGYVKHFYRVEPSSPGIYHLVLDTVRLGWDLAEKLIVTAAQSVPATP